MKVAVVGGGLAGLAAALDLVDAGHEVDGLRGAADARRRGPDAARARGRSGAAARQRAAHRARLLHRVPRASSSGSARAARTCGRGSRCRCSTRTGGSRRSSRACRSLLRYRHLPLRDRLRIPLATLRCRTAQPRAAARRSAQLLRRLGASDASDRPLLGRLHPAGAQPPLRRGRRGSRPLHRADRAARPAREQRPRPADEAARLDARRRGRAACSATASGSSTRVESLDELDADAIVVAVPPRESARLLGEPAPALEDSPIVSVHLWFDRPLLGRAARGAARLGRALGLRPRRADRAASPSAGSTSPSSRAACPSCSRCAGASSSSGSPAS